MIAMSIDPDKDMLTLPAEAKLGGPKMPSAPPSIHRDGVQFRTWEDHP